MNEIIKEQLNNCKVAKVPSFDDGTTTISIPIGVREIEHEIDLAIDACYLIKVDDYIIKPYKGFTLHDNWNNGVIPTDIEMKVAITNIMGKMIRVDAVGNNDGLPWSGWLPKKSIKIISRI